MYWGYFYKSEKDTILHSILVSKNAYDKLCELLVRYKNETDGNFKYACVAIAGDWFTANGKGINLGYFGDKENKKIAKKMMVIFSEWINNGHNNFEDKNLCILQIELTDDVLFSQGTRYDIDFTM